MNFLFHSASEIILLHLEMNFLFHSASPHPRCSGFYSVLLWWFRFIPINCLPHRVPSIVSQGILSRTNMITFAILAIRQNFFNTKFVIVMDILDGGSWNGKEPYANRTDTVTPLGQSDFVRPKWGMGLTQILMAVPNFTRTWDASDKNFNRASCNVCS